MRAYDPTPIIHMRNNHPGRLEDCEECRAIKAKYPEVTKWE